MTIQEVFSKSGIKNFKKYTGEIGLEIETETKNDRSYPEGFLTRDERGNWKAPLKFWDIHVDGSLRDFGLEYVLKQPLMFHKELPEALGEFGEKTAKVKFIKDSVTTSVHVHLNMLNESFKTMGNFLTLYTLFENMLIKYSGPDRLSNLFCLPICDAEDTSKNMIYMLKAIEAKGYRSMILGEGGVKYAALNLSAFGNYGSMEIRSFRGETDIKEIGNWTSILYSLLEYARKDVDPKDIMLSWREGQKKFIDEVFDRDRSHFNFKEEIDLVDSNVWYAASAAYSIKDWSKIDEEIKIPEFKPKQKDLDAQSSHVFGLPWERLDSSQQAHILNTLRQNHDRKYFNKKIFNAFDEPRATITTRNTIPQAPHWTTTARNRTQAAVDTEVQALERLIRLGREDNEEIERDV